MEIIGISPAIFPNGRLVVRFSNISPDSFFARDESRKKHCGSLQRLQDGPQFPEIGENPVRRGKIAPSADSARDRRRADPRPFCREHAALRIFHGNRLLRTDSRPAQRRLIRFRMRLVMDKIPVADHKIKQRPKSACRVDRAEVHLLTAGDHPDPIAPVQFPQNFRDMRKVAMLFKL